MRINSEVGTTISAALVWAERAMHAISRGFEESSFVTVRHATDLSPEMVELESPLLLDFDPRVLSYEAQPVRIPLPRRGKYVPALLVSFQKGPDGVEPPRDLLEVKTQAFLDRYADEYAAKLVVDAIHKLIAGSQNRQRAGEFSAIIGDQAVSKTLGSLSQHSHG